LPRCFSGAGGEPVEVAAHELGDPALRHVAGKGHRALLAVDGQHGANHLLIGLSGIADQQREEQGGAGQTPSVVCAEIPFIEIKRGLAVELVEHIAGRTADAAARAEFVSAASAAVANAHRIAVEADRGDLAALGRTIRADQGLLEQRAMQNP
jgi:hypothetical protein